jgi:hypothetical protein
MDTAITIRSAVVREDKIHLTAGAGIVARSIPEREYDETEHKAGAIKRALAMAVAEAGGPAGGAEARGPAEEVAVASGEEAAR